MKNEENNKIRAFLSDHEVEVGMLAVGTIFLLIGAAIFVFSRVSCAASCSCRDAWIAPIVLALFGFTLLVFGVYVIIPHREQNAPARTDPEEKAERQYEQTGNYLYHPVFDDWLHPERHVIEGSTQEKYRYFADISREQGIVEHTALMRKVKLSGLLFLIGILSFVLIGVLAPKLKNSGIGVILLQILCYVGYGGCTIAAVMKFVGALHGTIKIRDVRRARKAIGKEIRKRLGNEALEGWNEKMARLDSYEGKHKGGI